MQVMLASPIKDVTKDVTYPAFVSTKLDGVRCVIVDGVAMSRSMKPIPSVIVQDVLGHSELNGLDGELIVGHPNSPSVYRDTIRGVMSKDNIEEFSGVANFLYFVFDDASPDKHTVPYRERLDALRARTGLPSQVIILDQALVRTEEELLAFEERFLADGYEGVMVRSPDGLYLEKRSSLRDKTILKLKRFSDSEAEILGFDEQMHNANPATLDNLGRMTHSSHLSGMEGKGTLGALQVRDIVSNVHFSIGTGMDDELRAKIWENKDAYLGKLVKYKFFQIGVKDLPRFPVFVGFRSAIDL